MASRLMPRKKYHMPTIDEITPDMALPHNVFADIGLSNPEMRQAKAYVSILIEQKIDALGLNQTAAAKRMGLRQPEVSKIVRGINSGFSLDRMLEALTALGEEVEIVVRSASPEKLYGSLQVIREDDNTKRSRLMDTASLHNSRSVAKKPRAKKSGAKDVVGI